MTVPAPTAQPLHHPSEETLFGYGSGGLSPAAGVLVAAHLEVCRTCADEVAFLEDIGAALVLSCEPVPLSAAAQKRTTAMIARTGRSRRPARTPGLPRAVDGRVGPWRWAGPGLRVAKVSGSAQAGERLYLLRAQPGAKLPHHGHSGAERVMVLEGVYIDGEHYGPGDFCETTSEFHTPQVSLDGPLHLSCRNRWSPAFARRGAPRAALPGHLRLTAKLLSPNDNRPPCV